VEIDIDNEKLKVTIADQGPGIPDIPKAMEEGFSTATPQVREMGFGAGMGLSNMKRNCDILNITSEPGKGTFVEMITYLKSDAR
jgi:anti-sigma regulatory factor (Ser/Thr protein kinase)